MTNRSGSGVVLSDGPLCLYGCADGVDDARELRQHTVAHKLDDPPMVLSDFGIDQIGAQGLEGRYCAFLVRADQTGVADNVGSQYGGETALHSILPPAL